MNEFDLLHGLAERLAELVSNTLLYGQDGLLHVPQVIIGDLPQRQTEDDDDYPYPFVLVKFVDSVDNDEIGTDGGRVTIWVFVGAYQEGVRDSGYVPTDPIYTNKGWDAVLQVMNRIRLGLLSYRMIRERYSLVLPLQREMAQDQAEPQYLGWFVTTWTMPVPQNERGLGAIFNGKYEEIEAGCPEPVRREIATDTPGTGGN